MIMAWESKYSNYGVLKIEGNKVNVFFSQQNFISIWVGEMVTNAVGAGDVINVTLSNGKIRRYSTVQTFITVWFNLDDCAYNDQSSFSF